MFKTLVLLTVALTTSINVFAQKADKEKFTGENNLKDCLVEIPLYYSTKGQQDLKAAAEKYKDIEIVLLTAGKKGKASYTYYYLVGHESSYGPSASLIKTDVYRGDNPNKSAFFLNYKPKIHGFYLATCFKEKLKQYPDISKTLTEDK